MPRQRARNIQMKVAETACCEACAYVCTHRQVVVVPSFLRLQDGRDGVRRALPRVLDVLLAKPLAVVPRQRVVGQVADHVYVRVAGLQLAVHLRGQPLAVCS